MKIRRCKNCGHNKFIISFGTRKTCFSCRKEKREERRNRFLSGKENSVSEKAR